MPMPKIIKLFSYSIEQYILTTQKYLDTCNPNEKKYMWSTVTSINHTPDNREVTIETSKAHCFAAKIIVC